MKRGAWSLFDRFEIPNLDDPDELYLTRWRIIETPWCALFLHRVTAPDSRPTLHDHPWSFLSIIVRGGYDEIRLNLHDRVRRRHRRTIVNVMRRDDAHYIERLHRNPTWTLLLVGKRRRTWGYWREIPGTNRASWSWTPFDRDPHNDEFQAAMAHRRGAGRPHAGAA